MSEHISTWTVEELESMAAAFGIWGGNVPEPKQAEREAKCPTPASPMTPTEAARRMLALARIEENHYDADQLLMEIARRAGYGEAVDAYDDIPKWFE